MSPLLSLARSGAGLAPDEFSGLLSGPDSDADLTEAASFVRRAVFGRRMRVFAPLYLSNLCVNECLYCGFRLHNKEAVRRTLTHDELRAEVGSLLADGHRHLLLVSGEVPAVVSEAYLLRALSVISEFREVQRVDLEIGPLPRSELGNLARAGFHSFVLYQETYDASAYARWHVFGPKADPVRRRAACAEALSCGFPAAGLGVLLGLSPDWRGEVAALFAHARELSETFQVVPSFSLPRFRPADGIAEGAPTAFPTDAQFTRALACLRLGMPDAEIVLSTREEPSLRDALIHAGVSTVSAGSMTNPGGYGSDQTSTGQFEIADHRDTASFIGVLEREGFEPFPFRRRRRAAPPAVQAQA